MIKLLLDENISFKVAKGIKEFFEEVNHLSDLRLINSSDIDIWQYAKNNHYSIITFDSDFIDLSLLYGFPPKVIWLRMGNSSSIEVISKLRASQLIINDFLINPENAFLELN